jgi:hypothetical protein
MAEIDLALDAIPGDVIKDEICRKYIVSQSPSFEVSGSPIVSVPQRSEAPRRMFRYDAICEDKGCLMVQ